MMPRSEMTARKLITLHDIESARESGERSLDVAGAIVTPLARDAARRAGVTLTARRAGAPRAAIFANWKSNGTAATARALARAIVDGWVGPSASPGARDADLAIFPPFPHLALVGEIIAGTPVALGAQDLSPFPGGAFTGAVSAGMLKDLGCRHVLVGHSERRHAFGEGDEVVAAKLGRALSGGLDPVLCIGETLAQRDAGRTHAMLRGQLLGALDGVEAARLARLTIAYEPVWAIGTGLVPSAPEAEDALSAIRDHLARKYGDELAAGTRILYGGSVTAGNSGQLRSLPSCDGLLVGGASLKAAEFLTIAGTQK